MEQSDLSFIPVEVIEHILESKELTFIDVCNFGSTCSLFWQLVNKSNPIWKAKFKQLWPDLVSKEVYRRHQVSDWRKEFRQRWLIGQKTLHLISQLSELHLMHEELSASDFTMFEEVITKAEHDLALTFMIDELMRCVHHENKNTNLTDKYYSEKTLRHLRQLDLARRWEEFKSAPPEKQLLEHGAVIIAQWSQPLQEITDTSIGCQLDSIAAQVRLRLQAEHGDKHPTLCVSSEEQARWQTHNLSDNHYSAHVSNQVIRATSTVLFQELGFYGNSELYYSHENSYINKVLELRRGIPITLSIVFESVTRRLGVKCEPVSFPGHFLLRWRDTYKENVPAMSFYIDVFNGGDFLGKDSCPQFSNGQGRCPMSDIFRFGPATALQVVERMANNLEVAGRQRSVMNGRAARLRSALELVILINPANLNCLLQLARFYMQYNMDVGPLRETIQTFDLRDMGQAAYILRTLRDYDLNFSRHLVQAHEAIKQKTRTGLELQFAVGMVLHHRLYDYTCVVIGWDPVCAATEDWRNQMNIKSLSRQHLQPFYHVLVNDGTSRYAAEENLEMETVRDCWVTHSHVGRFLDTFCDSYYIANPPLRKFYPEDLPAVLAALRPL